MRCATRLSRSSRSLLASTSVRERLQAQAYAPATHATQRSVSLKSDVFRVPCSVGKPCGFGSRTGSAHCRGSAPVMGAVELVVSFMDDRELRCLPRRILILRKRPHLVTETSSVAQTEPHRKDTSPDFLPQFSRKTLPDSASRRRLKNCRLVNGPIAKTAPRLALRRKCIRYPVKLIVERDHTPHHSPSSYGAVGAFADTQVRARMERDML